MQHRLHISAARFKRAVEVTRLLFKAVGVPVEFTKEGLQHFLGIHSTRVSALTQSIIVKADLGLYIAAHEEHGIYLDTECQEVCYQPGLYLLLRKEHGVWYVIDDIYAGNTEGFMPVYIWKCIKCGFRIVTVRFLSGWRRLLARDQKQSTNIGGDV